MVSSSAVVVWKRSEIVSRAVSVPATLHRVKAQSLSRHLRVRGATGESSVSEPVGQLLMSIALGKVELLELVSEALQIDRRRYNGRKWASIGRSESAILRAAIQNQRRQG